MKKSGLIILGVILLIVVILIGWYVGAHNSIIALEEKVNTEYSNINVQLERRADLIPNLVNTVKGYMAHEESIINSITEARENLVNAKKQDVSSRTSTTFYNEMVASLQEMLIFHL